LEQNEIPLGAETSDRGTFPASVYRVTVEQTIFGVGQGEVLVTQAGGIVENEAGERTRVILDQDEALEVGEQYMFFLAAREDGTYSSPPFGRFHVEDGTLEAIGGWAATAGAAALDGLVASAAAMEVHSAAQ
jgi:hypothetical protein